ncbi:MAG: hypothetical protein ABJN95_11790 [Maribacter sp.]|uniref:hypothetical protein n=1 Tax=Maribacter sp. TaxID=1897614 RepID=UPI0032993B98
MIPVRIKLSNLKLAMCICLGLYSYMVSAQLVEVKDNTIDIAVFNPAYNPEKYDKAEGSPYSNEAFIPVKLDYLDKTQFVRFNLVDDVIELKSKSGKNLIVDLQKDFKIELLDGSNKFYYTGTFSNEGVKSRSFFELVKETESFRLFKKERKKFIEKPKVEAYQDEKYARFIAVNDLYYISDFKTNSSQIVALPRKKKKFVAFFEEKGKLVEKFIKAEKLDIKKQEDLIQIMDFLFTGIK